MILTWEEIHNKNAFAETSGALMRRHECRGSFARDRKLLARHPQSSDATSSKINTKSIFCSNLPDTSLLSAIIMEVDASSGARALFDENKFYIVQTTDFREDVTETVRRFAQLVSRDQSTDNA